MTGGGRVRGAGRGEGEVVTRGGGGQRRRERGEAGELSQGRARGEGEAVGDRGEEGLDDVLVSQGQVGQVLPPLGLVEARGWGAP